MTPDRMAVDTGEAGDPGAAVVWADLEEAVPVDDGIHDQPGVVDPASVAGHSGDQGFLAPLGIVLGFDNGRRFPDVGRQVGEEPADLGDGIRFVLGEVHDDAVLDLDPFVPQVLLGDDLPRRLLDHLRPGHEYLAGVAHHHVEVAHARLHGGQSRHGPEHGGHHGNELQQLGGEVRARVAGQVGAAHLLEGLDAAAGGVEEPHVGDPGLQREPFREAALVADGGIGGTAPDGEVAALETATLRPSMRTVPTTELATAFNASWTTSFSQLMGMRRLPIARCRRWCRLRGTCPDPRDGCAELPIRSRTVSRPREW